LGQVDGKLLRRPLMAMVALGFHIGFGSLGFGSLGFGSLGFSSSWPRGSERQIHATRTISRERLYNSEVRKHGQRRNAATFGIERHQSKKGGTA
jgi:hypothetical protein